MNRRFDSLAVQCEADGVELENDSGCVDRHATLVVEALLNRSLKEE